jgi:hypothetical protein
MVSKLCSRSQGQPPGARSRAMMATRRSNLSPVVVGLVGIAGVGILIVAHEWVGKRRRSVHFWDSVRFSFSLFALVFFR